MTSSGISVRPALVVARWLLGMALISWRYLWQITPLHRTEEPGDESDLPPELPDEYVDERCQLLGEGVGPLFHRRFVVHIVGSSLSARELMSSVTTDLNRAVPREVALVHRTQGREKGRMCAGDEFLVRMPGPWNAPVRAVECTDHSFRLATLRGHLEAGEIEFRARPEGDVLLFEIEAWARPSSRLVHLLYTKVRLAKEMQLSMWVRFCLHVASLAGGRPRDGVSIHTRRLALA